MRTSMSKKTKVVGAIPQVQADPRGEEDAVIKRRLMDFCLHEGIEIVGYPIAHKVARPGALPVLQIDAGWGFIRKEAAKTTS